MVGVGCTIDLWIDICSTMGVRVSLLNDQFNHAIVVGSTVAKTMKGAALRGIGRPSNLLEVWPVSSAQVDYLEVFHCLQNFAAS